jgi:hypothetical protein
MLFGVHGVCSTPKWSKDGFTHGRWFMMYFHIGDSLLSGCLTSIGCLLGIILSGVGVR